MILNENTSNTHFYSGSVIYESDQPALADADIAAGAKVFNVNCASCHMGGGNVINAAKTLKKDALVANAKDTTAAIVTQVTKGKGAMPAFKGRLTEEQIASVTAYVLDKAEKGW
ncbi:cytochrome c6 PetJ [Phormidesmis sp. 146-33]